MSLKFGTSGVRGLNTELTHAACYAFTQAFLKHAEGRFGKKSVVVAIDRRVSSPRIESAVAEAARTMGLTIHSLGVVPTPALAYYCQNHDSYGIMVTGSHIPADRNGLKFYFPQGEILKEDEKSILENYDAIQDSAATPPEANEPFLGEIPSKAREAADEFVRRYTDFFAADSLHGLHAVFYEHSATSYLLFPEVLRALGAKVIPVGASTEFVAVDTEAVTSLDQMRLWQKENAADVVISTDGDSDRPLVVDESGRLVRGDILGLITSLGLGIRNLAVPVSCNSVIVQSGELEQVVLTKIGSPFVIEAMDELMKKGRNSVAGFEANGGYLLGSPVTSASGKTLSPLPTRDSFLPVIQSLVYARNAASNRSLASAIDAVEKRFTASDVIRGIPVEVSGPFLSNAMKDPQSFVKSHFADLGELENTNTLDGLRLYLSGGRIFHLRPSGNAPEFRVYTEAPTPDQAEALCQNVMARLRTILKA